MEEAIEKWIKTSWQYFIDTIKIINGDFPIICFADNIASVNKITLTGINKYNV